MIQRLWPIWTLLLVAALATCGASASEDTPATAPALAEEEPLDLVREILSYDAIEEHIRFVVAAGESGELSEAAFHENHKRHNPFARPFDRWELLLPFDRNGNGTLSWPEAARYRAALKKAILAAYDVDRDGQLTGEERLAANRALADGKLPPLKAESAIVGEANARKDAPAPTARLTPPPTSQPASQPAAQPAESEVSDE
jgi:hypothetical protein